MSILNQIMQQKTTEVAAKQRAITVSTLESFEWFSRPVQSAKAALSAGGVIAEHKRRSPSKAVISTNSRVQEVVKAYDQGGAAVMSILTDTVYFGGSLDDLIIARNHTEKPLLRKDFIFDPYQVYEAKAYGADLILLIAAALSSSQINELSAVAHELGLEVLLEVHDQTELLEKNNPSIDLLGVNHRNLKTFDIDLGLGERLFSLIPATQVAVAESGLSERAQIARLFQQGFKGFLIGEYLMSAPNPTDALQTINDLFK
ncbi:MAG: indole-3-glycerol phosphate synthase TrpC [Bacteroidota bacterium]|jgi:indole-3-glycerol phosphate synthase